MEEKVISASEMGGANSENLTISTESEQNNMANTVEQDITAGTSSEQVESAASEKPEKYSKLKYNFKKAYDFVSRHWLYFSVPLLIFALFFGILYSMDIFPFGTDNMSAFIRKMVIDGYVVKLEIPELKEILSLLRYSSNNLNQLTKRVHETGRIYDADLEDIHRSQDRIWTALEKVVATLAKL